MFLLHLLVFQDPSKNQNWILYSALSLTKNIPHLFFILKTDKSNGKDYIYIWVFYQFVVALDIFLASSCQN